MLRILQMGMTDNRGGIESYLINYYRNIDRKKIQFDFVNIYSNHLCFQDELEKMGANIYKVSSYYRHPVRYLKEVSTIIKKNKYKIVHCNMNSAVMLYPLIAARLGGAKIIISHAHNSSSDKGFLKTAMHWINKHFISFFANVFIACSKTSGMWFFSKSILNSKKYYLINNAVDTSKYAFDIEIRKKIRKELKIVDSTVVLGHVGRFVKQKNHSFLIDIFAAYHKENPDSKLMLVGTGPLLEDIKRKVKNLCLEDSVLFLGQRENTQEIYQAMDIFLLPSLYEGLPLVGVEAQASGLPCFFSENVTDEINLLAYNERISLNLDVHNWSNALLNVKLSLDKRSSGAKIVREAGFAIDLESEKLMHFYEEVLKK